MKKYIISIALGLVIGFSAYYFKYKCEEPTQEQVELVTSKCYFAMLMNAPKLTRNDICTEIGKGKDCELVEADRPAIENVFKKMFFNCIETELSRQRLCTDKLNLGI